MNSRYKVILIAIFTIIILLITSFYYYIEDKQNSSDDTLTISIDTSNDQQYALLLPCPVLNSSLSKLTEKIQIEEGSGSYEIRYFNGSYRIYIEAQGRIILKSILRNEKHCSYDKLLPRQKKGLGEYTYPIISLYNLNESVKINMYIFSNRRECLVWGEVNIVGLNYVTGVEYESSL